MSIRGVVDEITEGVSIERHHFITFPLDRIFEGSRWQTRRRVNSPF
jgi:hypothetical protein